MPVFTIEDCSDDRIPSREGLVDTMLNLDSATVPVVIAVLGSVCVLAGLFGSMTGTINLPTLNNGLRWGAGIFGSELLLLGSAMWLFPQTREQMGADHETLATS